MFRFFFTPFFPAAEGSMNNGGSHSPCGRKYAGIVTLGLTFCCEDGELTMHFRKIEGSAPVAVQTRLVLANGSRALVFCSPSKLWLLISYVAARVSARLTAVSNKVRSSAAVSGTLPTGPDRPPRCC